MVRSFLKRYGLTSCAAAYTGALLLLHAFGRFPAPGAYDLAHLAGSPSIVLEGQVLDFPMTRWGKTRFVLEGRAWPLEAFHGRAVVNLEFPLTDLAPGERLWVRGWLSRPRPAGGRRSFDEKAYWASYGAYAVLRVWSQDGLQRLDEHRPYDWNQTAWLFHQRFKRFWFDRLPPDEAAVISCMTMGSRGVLPAEIKARCIRAGIYHILVVSGQNVALIIAIGVAFLRLVGIRRRWTFWICCGPILFYTSAVGADPPVLRAATMAIAALAATAVGRDVPSYHFFVMAWLWTLIREPGALFGASFQLSFGATASLMALLPWFGFVKKVRSRLLQWVLEAGCLSVAVHTGVWPILVYYFHQLSLMGFIANWTLFPIAGLLMASGLAVGIWGVGSPETVPFFLLEAMHVLLRLTLRGIEWMSLRSWAAVEIGPFSPTVFGIYYVLLICILVNRRGIRHGQGPIDLSKSRRRI